MNNFWDAIVVLCLVLLVLFVIAMVVDIAMSTEERYANVPVVGKEEGTRTMLIGKALLPRHYWELSFQIGDETLSGDVSKSCYEQTRIGDRMDIRVRRGKVTLDVYPDCK